MSLSQMHPSGGGPVSFFGGTIFAWWAHSRLGTQKPSLVRILLLHSRVKTKKKKRSSSQMHPSGIGPVAFFSGTIFTWRTHSRWGAQKPLLVRILPSHSGVKTQNKKGLIANAHQWRRSCWFLLGHNSRFLRGEHIFYMGGTNGKLGAQPRNDPRGAGPAWMFLLEINCNGWVV